MSREEEGLRGAPMAMHPETLQLALLTSQASAQCRLDISGWYAVKRFVAAPGCSTKGSAVCPRAPSEGRLLQRPVATPLRLALLRGWSEALVLRA